ncbi:hypothetical protein [Flammeovirga sp. OC4]|nr:hypothetical protein [Flammeovirga sp. OC4]
MISYFFKIPFPEQLPDEVYWEKAKQIQWLAEKGVLGIELEKGEN